MLCSNCKKDKPSSEFRKNKNFTARRGLSYRCKSCDTDTKRTKRGHMEKLYHSMRYNSQGRKHDAPEYSKAAFFEWCTKNKFDTFYDNWVKSDYDRNLAPSIDRINPSKPYHLNNIQVTTWEENHSLNTAVMGIKVTQMKDGRVVNTFNSIREAARTFSKKASGSAIKEVLDVDKRSAYGHQWVTERKKKR